ncbi:partner and localizer of BRCA2 isoform X1 [Phycodurus eques]|uniref:partner and localizer of BRCA2 isoform X1 n=1 Tax=Phycodurus eques TaxID=693459 RepID=UPI002ACEF13B|nr:partner and localizer of BRCA2 isoform X1 [Phycodurus eques]XP_061536670.1 partner and localizer of BRCA2 isoform X1 [Phycodurus eques]
MQSSAVGDVLHCEEQLRSTLYCDDKDDLRRKLAQLRREYLKTAQKLQRAERQEAVRKHVRNDVTPKQDQTEPEGTPKPTYGGPADSSSLVRTLLPSTPEPDLVRHNPPCVSRASPALRLRSRRSRMRWQSHSEEGGKVQGDARFADESQSSGSVSPSLLLSHWNVPALEDEKQEGKKEAEVPDGNRTENHTVGGDGGHVTLDEKSHENLEKQASYFKPSFCSVETIAGGEGDGKRLLESCTLVEGLLFPAEYYIRTTRSMALSQSQPDLRAVIHTQLNSGRPRQKKANPVASSKRSSPMSISKTPIEAVSPPRVTCLRKGRKSQRGRGRGKPRVQRPSPSPGPSSLHETNSPKSHSSLEEVEPPSGDPKATSPDTQPSSGAQKVLPILYKMVKSTPVASGSEKWRSLLLPSSKPTPTPLLPPLSQLAGDLLHLDLHQDFHLPDDQFASLKLSKLRQVAVESRAEPFASLCHNTGGVLRHPGTPVTTLSVPLSLTPMAGKSSSQSKDDDSWNMQLTGTSHLDPPSICQSPEEQELKCGDRDREVLPCRDHPREEGQEENRLKDFFPKTVRNEHSVNSQLRLSPPVASAPLHPPSSTFPSSPVLPSLGFTPLASLPTATVVPLLSPSTRTQSPQHLATLDTAAPAPDVQMLTAVEEHRSCTLKAPAGGVLVDACCLLDSGSHLCIAAAGKWAVCLWSRASSLSDWTLRHTWPFTEPVINIFSIPDAAGLMCVTLGQLEIIEVRVLSCCGSKPGLLLDGGVQAAVGVAQSRVVTSSYSASGCTLQVFTLSNDGSTSRCVPLGSPGVCVGALAQVDALPDALIGTDEGGRLFVWNLKSGHLLQKIQLSDSLSNTSCLRGFSCSGVLLVLLQHLSLGCHQDEKNKSKDETFFNQEEKEKKSVLFSLVALNPLTGKSVLAARLDPPTSWSGRLCEADASSAAVAGLSQSGCVCMWQLRRRSCDGVMVAVAAARDCEGWQLARWAEGGATLVMGHQNGDITLHFDLATQDDFMGF